MPSEASLLAEQQRQLSGLAELSLAMAQKVQAAALATEDTGELVRLADAFAKVSRCLRMCIALSMRLTRGERPAPAHEDRDLELELDLEIERDDFEDSTTSRNVPSKKPLRSSRRRPPQIATIARTLASAPSAPSRAYAAAKHHRRSHRQLARPPGERLELVEQAIPTATNHAPTAPAAPLLS